MTDWAGSAFVWVPGNVPLTGLPAWIKRLFVQLCSGLEPSEQCPDQAWVDKARQAGFEVAAWHWCTGEDVEAKPNTTPPSPATTASRSSSPTSRSPTTPTATASSAKFKMPGRYLAALAWDGPLGVTTTPLFASDMTGWRDAGAINMPQSFPTAAEGGHSLPDVVAHHEAWGWPRQQTPAAWCRPTRAPAGNARTRRSRTTRPPSSTSASPRTPSNSRSAPRRSSSSVRDRARHPGRPGAARAAT